MVRIIGITGDVRAAWLPGAPPRETIYLPESLLATSHSLLVHLRTSGEPYAKAVLAAEIIKTLETDSEGLSVRACRPAGDCGRGSSHPER